MKSRPFILAALASASVACTQKNPSAVPVTAAAPSAMAAMATTRQIMLAITAPTSDVVFQVGADAPDGDAAWEKLEANAMALAESGNLLKAQTRLVDGDEWVKYADALAQAAQSAARAAQNRNADEALEAGDQIYNVCDECHKKYLPARNGG